MAFGFVKLLGLATLAVLGATNGAQPVNALTIESHHVVRHDIAHHGILARRQVSTSRRQCRAPTPAVTEGDNTPAGNSGSDNSTDGSSGSGDSTGGSGGSTGGSSDNGGSNNGGSDNGGSNNGGGYTPPTTPQPTYTPPPPTGGARKTGIAFSGAINVANLARGSTKLFGIYNWSSYKDKAVFDQLPGVEFITMLWGRDKVWEFQQTVQNNPGYSRFALAFNEPDQSGQSNMSPWEAAGLWRQYLEPLKGQGYTLISPAPTNSPTGTAWLTTFINEACAGCSVDAVATHFYGTDAEALIGHINMIHNTFWRNVWLTEFACQDFSWQSQCSDDQIWAFMKRTTEYMDSQDWVSFYSWFGAFTDGMIADVNPANRIAQTWDSYPNALGRFYLGS